MVLLLSSILWVAGFILLPWAALISLSKRLAAVEEVQRPLCRQRAEVVEVVEEKELLIQ